MRFIHIDRGRSRTTSPAPGARWRFHDAQLSLSWSMDRLLDVPSTMQYDDTPHAWLRIDVMLGLNVVFLIELQYR